VIGQSTPGQGLGEGARTEGFLQKRGQRNLNLSEEDSMTIDPVCGMTIDERNPQLETKFAGKQYFFCSEECRQEFEDHPEEFLEIAA
jgi:YHS domain-containing protein